MLSADEVRALAADLESDRIERTLSTTDTEKFREAICAFSNDMPAHGLPGYLLIGVDDSGRIVGAKITDQLLQSLAQRRDDGRIQPIPTMSVGKVEIGPGLAVVVGRYYPRKARPSGLPAGCGSGAVRGGQSRARRRSVGSPSAGSLVHGPSTSDRAVV